MGGNEVVAVAIREETLPELEKLVSQIHWFHVGELQGMIDTFLKAGVERLVMAGKITKTLMFERIRPDARLMKVFEKTPIRNDDALLRTLAEEFEPADERTGKSGKGLLSGYGKRMHCMALAALSHSPNHDFIRQATGMLQEITVTWP